MFDELIDLGEWIVLLAAGLAIVAVTTRRTAATLREVASPWSKLWSLVRSVALVGGALTSLVVWLELSSDYHDAERTLAILVGGLVLTLIGVGVVLAGAIAAREALVADALRQVRETSGEVVHAALGGRSSYPDELSASLNLTPASVDIRLADLVGRTRRNARTSTFEWVSQQPETVNVDLSSALARARATALAAQFESEDLETAIAVMCLLVLERTWAREKHPAADREIGALRYRSIPGSKRFLAAAAFEFERPPDQLEDWEGAAASDFLDGVPLEVEILRDALETCALGKNELLRSYSLHCLELLNGD